MCYECNVDILNTLTKWVIIKMCYESNNAGKVRWGFLYFYYKYFKAILNTKKPILVSFLTEILRYY